MTDEILIHETEAASPNFRTELAEQLAALVPEAIADGKIDVTKLQELLADDVADASERFGLFWPGKKRALRAAQEPTTATLRPDFAESKDWDTTKNVFIEGDNLEVLKILQKHYHNKIKMIYIDPPYNTGKDFVYPDNYKEGLQSYLQWTQQVNEEGRRVSTNPETHGQYHSNWLNMMYPRLKLSRNLLTDDGAIFISIDDNEVDNLRKLCNEIFGERNFLGVISWRTATDNNPTNIATDHEYVVVYARNADALPYWSAPTEKAALIIDKYHQLRNIHHSDTPVIETELRKWIRESTRQGDIDLDGVSHYSYVDDRGVYYPGNSANTRPGGYNYDIIHPVTKQATAKPSKGWRWPEATFLKAASEGDVHWGADHTTVPKIKKRIETATELLKSSYYEDNRATSAQLATLLGAPVFDNPKSVNMLRRLLRFTTTGNDVILDFFAGSGSTAEAVMALNADDGEDRKWIAVQLPEPTPDNSVARQAGYSSIDQIARERIRRAGDKIVNDHALAIEARENPLDIGFRAYDLEDSNFTRWRLSSDVEPDRLELNLLEMRGSSSDDEATSDDLLTEILLKQGYSLTENIEPVNIDGLDVRSVGHGLVLAYLNEHVKPTLDQLRAVVAEDPAKIIVVEDAFQGDDELKTNIAQLCNSKNIEFWTA